jgi:hypothetical protein
MKRTILTILLSTIFFSAFSQVIKCKADAIAIKTKNEYTDRWSDWSKWEEVDILITIDPTNDRIKVFSKKDQVYDIIQSYGETYDNDGDKTIKWQCVNEDGLKCIVRLVKLYSVDGKSQLYIDFADMMWVYNIYKLD